MRNLSRLPFAAALVGGTLLACSAAPLDPAGEAPDESDLRAMTGPEIVGAIGFGETKDIDYAESPLYRALRVEAVAGDVLDAWARSEGLDAKLWILDAGSRTLTSNDNASAGTRDAHATFAVKNAGTYYLALRDTNRENGRFHVSLAARPPAGGGAPPPPAATLYGFTAGAKVAQKGSGTVAQNMGPSYKCHRKTTPPIPCGGWVSVTTAAGKTQVALGVLGHSDYYTYVSGVNGADQAYAFPPPLTTTRFWYERAHVELDAAGHGQFEQRNTDAQGYLQSTATYEVTAANGAILVTYTGALHPGSCNSYDETCTFRALAP